MYVQDRDKPIKTGQITGLRENFGRDDGIEEPYWGPSYIGRGRGEREGSGDYKWDG